MLKYILRRFASMFAVLFVTIIIICTLMYFVPGDPAVIMLGQGATKEAIATLHEQFHMDDPYLVKMWRYLSGLLQGDMGISFKSKTDVFTELMARYPTTLKLAYGSTIFGLIIGISAGIISAVKQYSVLDRFFTAFSLFGASAPSFWIAMMLVLIFAVKLRVLPATGSYGPEYWILPIFTMGLQCSASIMRMTRSSMLEVIRQDYVRTARAKGQTEFVVIIKHALRNALIPILTTTGIKLCGFLGGSVLCESVFALPGIGNYILDSVGFQDYNVVQGGTILICINCVIITFVVDMLYALVDPRIKAQYGGKSKKKAKRALAPASGEAQA